MLTKEECNEQRARRWEALDEALEKRSERVAIVGAGVFFAHGGDGGGSAEHEEERSVGEPVGLSGSNNYDSSNVNNKIPPCNSHNTIPGKNRDHYFFKIF